MKKIKELNQKYGKFYIYLTNQEIGNDFLKQVEKEGYTFGDGTKPTQRNYEDIIAVNPDNTICYVGFIGRIAYQCNRVIKIDYEKMQYRLKTM